MQAVPAALQPRIIGRYALYGEIASGGMATVHFGRLVGAVGFSRTVAIKRLHPQFAKDPEFVGMFLDEARLAARIQHPNVVSTLDVVPLDDEVFLVMDYVHGEALSKLIRAARQAEQLVPPRIAVAVLAGALHGLHAAHQAKNERGEPLNIVHRDVSPQNILVGVDGVARVLDFGVAKAAARVTSTRDGQMKGKVSYMAPEQLRGRGVDRRTDVFAAGVVLWEALTGKRLFDGDDPGEVLAKLLDLEIPSVRRIEPSVPEALDEIVMRALDRDQEGRWASARDFAIALEHAGPIALPREVGEWVEAIGGATIAKRAAQLAEMENVSSTAQPRPMDTRQGPASGVAATWKPPGEPSTNPSQVSHVTGISHPSGQSAASYASAPRQPAPASNRRGVLAALAGVAAAMGLVLVLLVVVLVVRSRRPAPEESDVVPVSKPSGAVATPEPARQPQPVETGVAPPIVSVAPPASAAPREPAASVTDKPVVKKPPPSGKGPATTSKPADNCDPPFVIDAKGVRRVKPGCG